MSQGGLITELVNASLALNAEQEWSQVALFTPYLSTFN